MPVVLVTPAEEFSGRTLALWARAAGGDGRALPARRPARRPGADDRRQLREGLADHRSVLAELALGRSLIVSVSPDVGREGSERDELQARCPAERGRPHSQNEAGASSAPGRTTECRPERASI